MPYVSNAQRGYFHAHKAELEKQGVNVSEWDKASKGKKLPKHSAKAARKHLEHKTAKRLKKTFPALPNSQNYGKTRSGLEDKDKYKMKGT